MRTVGTRVARPTVALVRALGVAADAVVANVGTDRALVHILGAVEAGVAGRAAAAVLAYQIATSGTVAAGLRPTLVNVLSAVVALVAPGTAALVALHQVHTEVVGLSGDAHTVVNVDLAVLAGVAGQAGAGQLQRGAPLLALLHAGSTVQAGAGRTGVIGRLTAKTHVPENARNDG